MGSLSSIIGMIFEIILYPFENNLFEHKGVISMPIDDDCLDRFARGG